MHNDVWNSAQMGMSLLKNLLDSPLWLLIFLVIVVVAVLALLNRKRKAKYVPRSFLFTKTEWKFAQVLQQAIQRDWLMMGKVRVADLLAVERNPKLKRSDWMRAFAKISSKHIDFVIVDPQSGRVMCCIELDDPSHSRKDRIERDIFVNAAFKQAGVPLLRIPTAKHYDHNRLSQTIHAAIAHSRS